MTNTQEYTQEISNRELQLVELEILKKFDKFCRERDLKYIMAGGTLLGAVRHRGFIPWDDDIDIFMPREDYQKFLELFDIPGMILGSTYTDRKWSYPFAKIIDPKIVMDEMLIDTELIGVYVDVFPLDGLPDSRRKSDFHFQQIRMLRRLWGWLFSPRAIESKHIIKKAIKSVLIFISRKLLDRHKVVAQIDNLSAKYPYTSSNYVGCTVWGYGSKERILKELMDERIELPFEDGIFFAPAGYHQYLSNVYGDYMQLPPEEKRISHHIHKVWYKT